LRDGDGDLHATLGWREGRGSLAAVAASGIRTTNKAEGASSFMDDSLRSRKADAYD
jgi:hypothetical protein